MEPNEEIKLPVKPSLAVIEENTVCPDETTQPTVPRDRAATYDIL